MLLIFTTAISFVPAPASVFVVNTVRSNARENIFISRKSSFDDAPPYSSTFTVFENGLFVVSAHIIILETCGEAMIAEVVEDTVAG